MKVYTIYIGQDYRFGSLMKHTYINEDHHENGISNYILKNNSAEILMLSRIMFLMELFLM